MPATCSRPRVPPDPARHRRLLRRHGFEIGAGAPADSDRAPRLPPPRHALLSGLLRRCPGRDRAGGERDARRRRPCAAGELPPATAPIAPAGRCPSGRCARGRRRPTLATRLAPARAASAPAETIVRALGPPTARSRRSRRSRRPYRARALDYTRARANIIASCALPCGRAALQSRTSRSIREVAALAGRAISPIAAIAATAAIPQSGPTRDARRTTAGRPFRHTADAADPATSRRPEAAQAAPSRRKPAPRPLDPHIELEEEKCVRRKGWRAPVPPLPKESPRMTSSTHIEMGWSSLVRSKAYS